MSRISDDAQYCERQPMALRRPGDDRRFHIDGDRAAGCKKLGLAGGVGERRIDARNIGEQRWPCPGIAYRLPMIIATETKQPMRRRQFRIVSRACCAALILLLLQ